MEQIAFKLLCGVVSHLLLAAVHRRDFENYGKVTSRLDGDGYRRNIDAHDVGKLVIEPEAVVHLSLHPRLEIYDEVDLLGILDRADAEQAASMSKLTGGLNLGGLF